MFNQVSHQPLLSLQGSNLHSSESKSDVLPITLRDNLEIQYVKEPY
jgi:hypothetical protein